MRLSSSFDGNWNGDSAPAALALALVYLESGVLVGVCVRPALVMVDFEDLGVGVSMFMVSKCRCCLWLLDVGRVDASSSELGLGGVSWKVLSTLGVSGGFVGGGSCRSSQLYHHGNPPPRISAKGVWPDFGLAFHNCHFRATN